MADENPTDALDFSIFDASDTQIQAEIEGRASFEDPAKPTDKSVQQKVQEKVEEKAVLPPSLEQVERKEEKSQDPALKPEEKLATERKPIELNDDDLVPILQDGKVVNVRWGDHKGSVMRLADYTRKTTRVAHREEQLEQAATLLEKREQGVLQILRDPKKLAHLYSELTTGQKIDTPAVSAEPKPEESELATTGDLTKTKDAVLKEAKAEITRVVQEAQEEAARAQTEAFEATLRSATEQTIDAILEEHKDVLADFPDVDVLIKRMAWRDHQPKNVEDMRKALVSAGQKLAGMLGERDREQKKLDAVKKAVVEKGIEPAGGAAPALAKKNYADSSFDEIDKDVMAWITTSR